MATLTVTKDKGGASRPMGMTVVLPSQMVPLSELKAIGKAAGLDGVALADAIGAMAMHERAAARFARVAAEHADKPKHRKMFEKLMKAHEERVATFEALLNKLKLPKLYVGPAGRMASFLAESMARAPLLGGSVDAESMMCALLDVAFTLAERSLADQQGLAAIAEAAKASNTANALGKAVKALESDSAVLEQLREVRAQRLVEATKVAHP